MRHVYTLLVIVVVFPVPDRKCISYPMGHWVHNSNRTLVHGKQSAGHRDPTISKCFEITCDFGLNVWHVTCTKIVAIMYRSAAQTPLLVKHHSPWRRKMIRFDGLQLIHRWWLSVCLLWDPPNWVHYSDVVMSVMAPQITGLGADQRKHQSSASLAFVRVNQRWPMDSPHKGPVLRKMFPFDGVTMSTRL